MNVHKNAKLTPKGREQMVQRVLAGEAVTTVARSLGISTHTVRKWVGRHRQEGPSGLRDRSSRPHKLREPTPQATIDRMIELRRRRLTGKHIAARMGLSRATVSRIVRRAGLSRLRDLLPAEPVRRYERKAAGDLLHLDIKRLGRFERPGHRVTGNRTGQSTPRSGKRKGYGWEYVHVCIDDHSRVAHSVILPDEKAESAIKHLKAAVGFYTKMGITVRRVMTDNGSCYLSKAFAKACRQLNIKHIRTKPYTPKTNGKAERFIQTALKEWAYSRAYATSDQRAGHLAYWEHMYNWHRPHGGLKDQTPISRLGFNENNLLRHHT